MSQWYYAKDGRQNGPVGIEELRSLARSGTLLRTDLVWNPSMKDWLPSAQVDGIFDAVEVPAGTSPAISGNPYATPDSAWVPAAVPAILPDIEPGSDPIGVMACLQKGFDLTKKNFLVLFLGFLITIAISIAVTMPFSAAQGLSQLNNPQPVSVSGDGLEMFQREMRTQYSVIGIISQIVSLVVSAFLMAGYYRIALSVASGLPSSPGQLFGEGGKLMRVLGVTVLIGIPSWIANAAISFADISIGGTIYIVMMLLTVFLWIRFGYAAIAIVDRDLGVGEGMKYSYSITRNNGFKIFGLGFLATLIAMLGVVACFVGIFFTFPVALMGIVVSYRWMRHGREVLLQGMPALQAPGR